MTTYWASDLFHNPDSLMTIQLHPKVCLEETLSDEELSDKMLHEILEARLVSLKGLVSRSYWQRAWVIQEATTPKAASQIVVWCGTSSSIFDTFVPKAQLSMSWSIFDGQVGKFRDVSMEALRFLISVRSNDRTRF
jgi:hypothetical protein